METEVDRLRLARQNAGYETAAAAIRHFRWTKSTTYCHENGLRGLTSSEAAKYAQAYGVSLDWLLTGSLGHAGSSREGLLELFDMLSPDQQKLLATIAKTFLYEQGKSR